ncbi:hypothetical protein LXA43DRAFT_387951 [Ganoderma leucocontextum]|nr:hypothetical protein LXA43DRAFT_387951 [Ganoderma leucocontextum]
MSASNVFVQVQPQRATSSREVQLDDVYHGSRALTTVSLKFWAEAAYLSTRPRLTAQTQWSNLRTLDLTVHRPGSQPPAPFYLTTYNFPVLTTLRLVNIPLDCNSELSTLRSLTLKNTSRLPHLRTDFQGFMQPLCASYRQLEKLTLDYALTDPPNPTEILVDANPLPLAALSVHDTPGRVSDVLNYLELAACTELHLATTIPGVRPDPSTPNPFLYLMPSNWAGRRPVQLREMNKVSFEVVTGRRVRVDCAYDPMGPPVYCMRSTGALRVRFDVNFDNQPSATAADVVLLQAHTLVALAETIKLLKMSAVSTIDGITEQRTEVQGVLDHRPGGQLQWYSRPPGRREWKEMTLYVSGI